MKDESKLSFWKKLKYSVFDFEKYQNLAIEKIGKTIWYLCALMIIFAIVVAGINTFKFAKMVEEVRTYIENNIDDIKLQNNELAIKMKNGETITKIENSNLGFTTTIATDIQNEEEKSKVIKEFESSGNGVLILKDSINIKNEIMSKPYSYEYKNIHDLYSISYMDKNQILDALSINKLGTFLAAFFLIMFIYMFVIYLSSALIDVLLLSIFGYFVSKITRINAKFRALYNMAVYSLTLPIILNILYFIINSFTGFTIRYFDVMYTTVATIYIATAILIIRSDLIKKQIELTKIIEEQDKVREELKRREEEKKEKQEEEKRKEEQKKKEKKEEDEGEVNQEPEGNNV